MRFQIFYSYSSFLPLTKTFAWFYICWHCLTSLFTFEFLKGRDHMQEQCIPIPSSRIPQVRMYEAVLYCTMLYCTVLYCTVLCCTVLSIIEALSFYLKFYRSDINYIEQTREHSKWRSFFVNKFKIFYFMSFSRLFRHYQFFFSKLVQQTWNFQKYKVCLWIFF